MLRAKVLAPRAVSSRSCAACSWFASHCCNRAVSLARHRFFARRRAFMQDYQAMLLKGAITLALLQGTWALTSPLKRLRRAATVTKGANVGLASLKPADLKIAGSAACGSYIQIFVAVARPHTRMM